MIQDNLFTKLLREKEFTDDQIEKIESVLKVICLDCFNEYCDKCDCME